MVNYYCKKCGKVFSQKGHYKYHCFKRKRPCTETLINTQPPKDNLTCKYCDKSFSRKDSLERHINNSCKIKIRIDAQIREREANKAAGIVAKRAKHTDDGGVHRCNYCFKIFTRSDNLSRHLNKYCKVRKMVEDEKERIYQDLVKRMNDQNKEINEMKKHVKQVTRENRKLKELQHPKEKGGRATTINNCSSNSNSNNNIKKINSDNTVNNVQNNCAVSTVRGAGDTKTLGYKGRRRVLPYEAPAVCDCARPVSVKVRSKSTRAGAVCPCRKKKIWVMPSCCCKASARLGMGAMFQSRGVGKSS